MSEEKKSFIVSIKPANSLLKRINTNNPLKGHFERERLPNCVSSISTISIEHEEPVLTTLIASKKH